MTCDCFCMDIFFLFGFWLLGFYCALISLILTYRRCYITCNNDRRGIYSYDIWTTIFDTVVLLLNTCFSFCRFLCDLLNNNKNVKSNDPHIINHPQLCSTKCFCIGLMYVLWLKERTVLTLWLQKGFTRIVTHPLMGTGQGILSSISKQVSM